MTYFDIVNRVQDVVNSHKILTDFGYGNLSDIKPNAEGGGPSADYPYLFLNPQAHTRSLQAITYNFNMIVMDMAKNEEEVLTIQSQCQQYIDDVLAQLRFGYTDQIDLTLSVTMTPFKERFQDTVAGMTATLQIIVPAPLNQCIAPIS